MRAPGVLPVLRGRGALPQGRALELPEERRAEEHARGTQEALQGARHSDRQARPLRRVGQALPLRQRGAVRGGIRDPQLHRRDQVQALVRGVPADRLVADQPHHLRRHLRVHPEPGDPPLGRHALHQPREHPQGDRPAVPGRPAGRARCHPLAGGRDAAQEEERPAPFPQEARQPQVPRPRVRLWQLPYGNLFVAAPSGGRRALRAQRRPGGDGARR